MKRFIIFLTFLTTSLSSFAQGLSDKDKLINNGAMETLKAIETDPAHENDILNNQPAEVRDLTLSLKDQGLKSSEYVQVENGEYAHIGRLDEISLNASAMVNAVGNQLRDHECRWAPMGTYKLCYPKKGVNCYEMPSGAC